MSTEEEWERVAKRVDEARAQRAKLLVGRERLVATIEALLFAHDPVGINFETNTDEYRPEAESIVIRLPSASSEDDAKAIVHEEFTSWFGSEDAGPPSRYSEIAREVWALWTDATES